MTDRVVTGTIALFLYLFSNQVPMTALSIFLISLIQGITEFLPISSSGHLILLPVLTGLADQGQTADVAAHFGTLAAVILYLRRDLIRMASSVMPLTKTDRASLRLFGILILSSLPVILVGLGVEILSPSFLRLTITVALANIFFAGWLYWADRQPVSHRLCKDGTDYEWSKLTVWQAIFIGIAQVAALIPGASRSGVTMTMARQLGLDRLSAARFSLLLSVPVICGAAILKTANLFSAETPPDLTALAAITSLSFVCALGAIRWLMGWLTSANFTIFVLYRLMLGLVLLGLIVAGAIN